MSLRSDAENDIQSLIDYFDNEPIVHFNGDCTTNYSSLACAVSGPQESRKAMDVDTNIADIPQNGG
ncbi:hypothetical protein SCLCIDRAFT_1220741 [Scleroderma citrinum Foug A]|uniref:Uncharacterized protein n=1 Tax=Scleroderma citrinum Foug A TaxID=1036808 RepID=A0A0C2Z247_9AGAM|nr:hypothetical protein SCLCIDRAFT_1220741 [Scleroderma citrinum Foug A]